jgi:hypothetical protein
LHAQQKSVSRRKLQKIKCQTVPRETVAIDTMLFIQVLLACLQISKDKAGCTATAEDPKLNGNNQHHYSQLTSSRASRLAAVRQEWEHTKWMLFDQVTLTTSQREINYNTRGDESHSVTSELPSQVTAEPAVI